MAGTVSQTGIFPRPHPHPAAAPSWNGNLPLRLSGRFQHAGKIDEGRMMTSRWLQQLVRIANPPEAENDAMMELVVYASEKIIVVKTHR